MPTTPITLRLVKTNPSGSMQTWEITQVTQRQFDIRCPYGSPEPTGKGLDKKYVLCSLGSLGNETITAGQIIGYAISTGAVTRVDESATVTLEWLE